MTLQGDEALISRLRESFSPHGSRAFDVAMMETVYGRPFCVEAAGERFPEPRPATRPIGGHLEGCRIGFDAGGSDRKVSAVVDGRTVYSDEVIWHPKTAADPGIISGRCSAPSARRRPTCPVWMPSASPPPASSGEMS